MSEKRAIVIGAGPVGAAAAVALKRQGWSVFLAESNREHRRPSKRSINLTLCRRGLRTLTPRVTRALYERGVVCPHRIVHLVDGRQVSLPYGLDAAHHLLSIARPLLTDTLLDEAEALGVPVHTGHECVRVDPHQGKATFLSSGKLVEVTAELLVGCDGTNSVLRQELGRSGASLDIEQSFSGFGYVEVFIPKQPDGGYCWPASAMGDSMEAHIGLHAWPRGEALLFAQPNTDRSFTASLFLPLRSTHPGQPSFEQIKTKENIRAFFARHFPDTLPFVPDIGEQLEGCRPAPLRSLKVAPYHFGRGVLLGDAAHTMVPFFGQGVNSGLEDVALLLDNLQRTPDPMTALASYSARRVRAGQAITDLSFKNFQELRLSSADPEFQALHRAERRIHHLAPEAFQPLLSMVSFSSYSYDQIQSIDARQAESLRAVRDAHDPKHHLDAFVTEYLRRYSSPVAEESLQAERMQTSGDAELTDLNAISP